MKKLEHIDRIHLDAAEGWLGLGDYSSASDELDQITQTSQTHSAVLLLRCDVFQAAEKWEQLSALADSLVQAKPRLLNAWIQRSYALHELKRTQAAFDQLLLGVSRFPKQWLIRYNLACYQCQLGNQIEAKKWLDEAIVIADEADIRELALGDPDLEPLWPHLAKI